MKSRVLAIGAIVLLTAGTAARAAVPTAASPYRPLPAAAAHKRAVAGQEEISLDLRALAALRQAGREPFRIQGFPTAPGARGEVVLRRFDVASPDARIRVTGPDGDTFRPLPEIAHFTGTVAGEPESLVYVAALPDTLVSRVRSTAGSVYVGPDEGRRGYVVRDAASPANALRGAEPWACHADALPAPPAALAPPAARGKSGDPRTPSLTGFQSANLIIETDQELLAHFSGDIDAMTGYLLTLAAQFNLIYERDLAFHLTVGEVHAWTTADPWNGPSPGDQLIQLGDWYHANRTYDAFPRATTFLASGRTVTGGIAYTNAICIFDFDAGGGHWGGAYGLTQLYADWPAQDWDLFSMLHEIGHNAGSHHTHCYNPPIDMCFSGESGCYSGPISVPPGGGTIMSYCYLIQPGGEDNVNLVFHQRSVTEQLLPYIQNASCTLAQATFPDVPTSNPFFHYVQTIFELGITGGCAGGNYCPSNPVTRAQMAVFLLKAKEGATYIPPQCNGTFGDVTCTPGSGFSDWIEELADRGITGGCGNGNYCPGATVTRKQMAPFLLKTLYGSSHVPAPCIGVFADVNCTPGSGFGDFIEELRTIGVTGGCATAPLRYCPDSPNTRAQMAVFLVKTFGRTW